MLTMAEIRSHLRLDADDASPELEVYQAAATDYITQHLGRPVPWSVDGAEVPVPASIKAAALLIVADLYENREAQFIGSIRADNPAVERLLYPYRVGLGI